jgi:putative transposase
MPIGRPWITLAIDVASRMVSGFYLSHDAPSIVSVALVLTQCTLRKDNWLSERGLGSIEWPVSGIPDEVHLDNAKEFHSHALVRGAQEYGIELSYRPLGRPHYGGHIERLIGTTMGAVHLLPGTTFSNTMEKGSYNSSKQATMTLAELEKWLALEVLGRYHRSIHSALGVPPLVAWAQGMKVRGSLRQVKNAKQFYPKSTCATKKVETIGTFHIATFGCPRSHFGSNKPRPNSFTRKEEAFLMKKYFSK